MQIEIFHYTLPKSHSSHLLRGREEINFVQGMIKNRIHRIHGK